MRSQLQAKLTVTVSSPQPIRQASHAVVLPEHFATAALGQEDAVGGDVCQSRPWAARRSELQHLQSATHINLLHLAIVGRRQADHGTAVHDEVH